MTRMTGPDCVVMCNLINTYIHTYSADVRTTRFRMFTRIMYILSTTYELHKHLPCCTYCGPVELWAVLTRFGEYDLHHGYFRFGSGFVPVFVKFYGYLMVHGYGSVKSRVSNGTV